MWHPNMTYVFIYDDMVHVVRTKRYKKQKKNKQLSDMRQVSMSDQGFCHVNLLAKFQHTS